MYSEQQQKIEQLIRSGQAELASRLCGELCEHHKPDAALLSMQGMIYCRLGSYEKAAEALAGSLQIQPDAPEVLKNLAIVSHRLGRYAEAVDFLKKVIQLRPVQGQLYYDLAKILQLLNRNDEAISNFKQFLNFQADHIDSYNDLGILLCRNGQHDEAIDCFKKAISLNPDEDVSHNNLGLALNAKGLPDEALIHYQQALVLNPESASTYNNIGVIFATQGKLSEAEDHFKRALQLKPDYADACSHLGNIYLAQRNPDDAQAAYRQALRLQPANAALHSKLLFSLNYTDKYSADDIYREHVQWGKEHGRVDHEQHHSHKARNVGQRLRVAYVSPDFRSHSVAFFIEALLFHHDRQFVDVFCYANNVKSDAMTQRLQSLADHWCNTCGMSDDQLSEKIRTDKIDILVDLAGHTAGNQLTVFAQKPAPIQVTWLGYPNTTGLTTMDYRFTDSFADPAGKSDPYYTEKLIRLPHSFLCYTPDDTLPVAQKNKKADGVTFASFNNLTKITPDVVALWSKILCSVPDSRLLIKCKTLQDQSTRERIYCEFEQQGISRQQLEMHGWLPTRAAHFKLYAKADIALDPYPYNGTTTTCDALWMGIPVITLAGDRHAGRVGVSLLSQLELAEFIATSEENYCQIAVKLASDEKYRNTLKSTLRQRMMNSPLCDGKAFARDVETAYREM